MASAINNRYSKEDLEVFRFIIEKKLDKAERQLTALDLQIWDNTQNKTNQGNLIDNSFIANDLDMLQTMVNRQRRYILDLKNALERIKNKSYGICIITGELIDKRRLIAVPTTTKSLEGKIAAAEL